MAEKKSSDIEENKIPVFTVIKNNAILKNIFVINQPPPSISNLKSFQPGENVGTPVQEYDEVLLVGRHPDCNIVLEHPSISRFHLRIHTKPISQKLSVTDLSSVHGTWVSEKKIETGVQVELSEGDTIRIGGSSRTYRLHWLPLSHAYDLDNPFVPDALIREEKEEESTVQEEGKWGETFQDENSLSVESKQIAALNVIPEAVESVFCDENSETFVKKLTPSAPPMPENMHTFSFPDEEVAEVFPIAELFDELGNSGPRKDHEQREISSLLSNQQFDKENQCLQSFFTTEVPSESENPQSSILRLHQEPDMLEYLKSSFSEEEEMQKKENQSPPRKDHEQKEMPGQCSVHHTAESVNSSLPGGVVLSEIEDQQLDKEKRTTESHYATERLSERENLESPPIRSEPKTNLPSIWSRRGKPASILQLQTGRSRGKSTAVSFDAEVEPLKHEDIENKSISKALFHDMDGEEDIFTPDKENFTPNTLMLKSMKKMGKLEEIKQSKSYKASPLKVSGSPSIHLEEDVFASSDKENQTPKVLQEKKSARRTFGNRGRLEPEMIALKSGTERLPFRSLLVNSAGKSKSEASVRNATTRSCNSVNCAETTERINNPSCNNSVGEGKRSWYIVVDSTCLLNKESRKSLELLQGLKGTQLIIPRIVIRELDCLKRRGSFFRRTSEVSSTLQWIEECMVKTKWWIHVQSSMEEGRPIAPTPPASPQSRFSEGSGGFPGSMPFSACGSLMEIVSPTAEDHILECALLFRRIKNDGQLILLSNNVTLKIKAMAEGLICETAEEFRESLVNPFSERFLWADSSPRGLTWSCLDDVVLREKYDRCTSKRPLRGAEVAKGLKLILLHNSQYGQISSVSYNSLA